MRLSRIEKKFGLKCHLYAKLEGQNPSGSVKDRAALEMIKEAERRGLISRGSVVIEATSGNLGISLAFLSAIYGFEAKIVMPKGLSYERRRLILSYGGSIVEVDGGMQAARERAKLLAEETKNAYTPSQFTNKSNVTSHYLTTGPEIFRDTRGDVDVFVCGVGSAGTISGAGSYLKMKKPRIKIIAVEPKSSPMLSSGRGGVHQIQGIGADFIPPLYNKDLVDEVICVGDEEAWTFTKLLAKEEGILAGISSGAALCAAVNAGMAESCLEKTIMTIFPDRGERYFSTGMFDLQL